MTTRALLLTSALMLAACSGSQSEAQPSPSPSRTVTPSVSLGPFTCSNRSGGVAKAFMDLQAIRIAHQNGFDRVTFEFAASSVGPSGLPPYELTQQASTQFVEDPSGQTVTLAGTAGLKLLFRNTSGAGTYSGSTDLKPSLPTVAEVRALGDFERVLGWGIGLNSAACFRTVELSSPTRLALDFQN